MRLNRIGNPVARFVAAAIFAAVWAGIAVPASAGTRLKERVYDDSFGNLIIVSPAGYKRIVVGKGYLAADYQDGALPQIVYGVGNERRVRAVRCHQPPVLWKGRGYMYGLADGEIPTPPIVCD